jgi:hypothetical protein
LVPKGISKLARLQPASASMSAIDHGPQVCPEHHLIMSSMYIFKGQWQAYSGTAVHEVERLTGSIHSADTVVDRYHLISISSFHKMKIYAVSFATFGPTRATKDFLESTQMHQSSTPGSIISSHSILMLLELQLIILMNHVWVSWEVRWSVDGGLSAL